MKRQFTFTAFAWLSLVAWLVPGCRQIPAQREAPLRAVARSVAFVAGAAKADFTPMPGLLTPSDDTVVGAYGRLRARAVYLEVKTEANGAAARSERLLLIVCDLPTMPRGLVECVQADLNSRLDLRPDELLLVATGVRTAPSRYDPDRGWFGPSFDRKLFDFLKKQIVQAALEASRCAQPAMIALSEWSESKPDTPTVLTIRRARVSGIDPAQHPLIATVAFVAPPPETSRLPLYGGGILGMAAEQLEQDFTSVKPTDPGYVACTVPQFYAMPPSPVGAPNPGEILPSLRSMRAQATTLAGAISGQIGDRSDARTMPDGSTNPPLGFATHVRTNQLQAGLPTIKQVSATAIRIFQTDNDKEMEKTLLIVPAPGMISAALATRIGSLTTPSAGANVTLVFASNANGDAELNDASPELASWFSLATVAAQRFDLPPPSSPPSEACKLPIFSFSPGVCLPSHPLNWRTFANALLTKAAWPTTCPSDFRPYQSFPTSVKIDGQPDGVNDSSKYLVVLERCGFRQLWWHTFRIAE